MPDPTDPGFCEPMQPDPPTQGHASVCGATLKQAREDGRTTCENARGFRTDHPGYGTCFLHAGSTPNGIAAAQEEQAKTVARRLGVPVETSAVAAVHEALAHARGQVLFHAMRVSADDAPVTQTDRSGLTRPSVHVKLYQEALREYARQARDAVQLGIEAAAVSVLQTHAHQLLIYTRMLLQRLGVDPTDPEVIQVVQDVARRVEAGEAA